jgi:hypothetical protein
MIPQWHFNQPNPGDKNREPVLGEFFATEASVMLPRLW